MADERGVPPEEPTSSGTVAGSSDLAKSALEAAKQAARGAAAKAKEDGRESASRDAAKRRRAVRTGRREPAKEWTDPVGFGSAIDALLEARGWKSEAAVASVLGDWARIVGDDIAAHCQPEQLRDGELTLVAESTAWATQIRLLQRQLLERLRAELGPSVVRTIKVHGPTAPSWRKGKLKAPDSRGPRDTYG